MMFGKLLLGSRILRSVRDGSRRGASARQPRRSSANLRIEPLEQRNLLSVGPSGADWESMIPRGDSLHRLAAELFDLYEAYEAAGNMEQIAPELLDRLEVVGDRVDIEVIGGEVGGLEFVERLESLGMEVTAFQESCVYGLLPIEKLDDLHFFPNVQVVMAANGYAPDLRAPMPWVSQHLTHLHEEFVGGASLEDLLAYNPLFQIDGDRVAVRLVTDADAAEPLAALENLGLEIESTEGQYVRGWLPIESIEMLSSVSGLLRATVDPPEGWLDGDLSGDKSNIWVQLPRLYRAYSAFIENGGSVADLTMYDDASQVWDGKVAVSLDTTDASYPYVSKMDALGMDVTAAIHRTLEGRLPVAAIPEIAAHADIVFAMLLHGNSPEYEALMAAFDGTGSDPGETPTDGDTSDPVLPIFDPNDYRGLPPYGDSLAKLPVEFFALYEAYEAAGDIDRIPPELLDRCKVFEGRVPATIYVDGGSVVEQLQAIDMEIAETSLGTVSGWIPIDKLDDVHFMRDVIVVMSKPSLPPPEGLPLDESVDPLPVADRLSAWQMEIAPGTVVVCLPTDAPINDIGAYVETLDWPEAIGPVTSANVKKLYSRSTDDGNRTMVRIDLAKEIPVADAIALLESQDFVESARSDRNLDLEEWVGPGSVTIALRTDAEIDDFDAYVESLDWPQTLGHIGADNVHSLGAMQRADGTVTTRASIHLQPNISVFDAMVALEQMDSIAWVQESIMARISDPIELYMPTISTSPPYGPEQTVALGRVDFVALEEQDPVDGELWYRFEASRDGILAAKATKVWEPGVDRLAVMFMPVLQLYEYTDAGELVEVASGTTGFQYDNAIAGQAYLLRVSDLMLGDVSVSIANQVTVDGDAVEAFGSRGEDTLEFYGGTLALSNIEFLPPYITWGGEIPSFNLLRSNTLILNGFTYMFDAGKVRSIRIDSNMENVTLHGNNGDDTLTDGGGPVYMAGQLSAVIANLRFEGDWGRLEMPGEGDLVTVIGHGGYDTASLFNSWQSDSFVGSPDASTMKSPSFEHTVVGFEEVRVNRPHAESSTIELTDSAADDHLLATPEGVTLSGDGYSIHVSLPAYVQTPANVHVVSTGGNDTAEFHDSPRADLFVATPTYACLSGGGYEIEAEHFGTVKAYATAGGVDVAKLYDSAGDDLFVGKPDFGGLSGEGFNNQAFGFDGVHAYATAGGVDLAKLFDSAGDDIFYGDPTEASLYRPGEFYNRAKFFEGVHAYATGGGNDTARLFGSDGNDRLVATPESSALFGTGFYNRAKYFEAVFAEAGVDGDDEASLQGDDSIRFLAAWADYAQFGRDRLGDGPLQQGYRATGFDRVKAIANPDGRGLYELLYPDDESPGERQFLLEYEGEWLSDD